MLGSQLLFELLYLGVQFQYFCLLLNNFSLKIFNLGNLRSKLILLVNQLLLLPFSVFDKVAKCVDLALCLVLFVLLSLLATANVSTLRIQVCQLLMHLSPLVLQTLQLLILLSNLSVSEFFHQSR